MRSGPKSVIHINFVVGDLFFDARPIWAALSRAAERGEVAPSVANELPEKFGETAIHLATRHYLMKRAIEELKLALADIFNQVSEAWGMPEAGVDRVIRGSECERARDRVLLAIDSFLFEFRAYLDLLAGFMHGILLAIGKGPSKSERLSSGRVLQITGKGGNLRPHDFLLYLCDKLSVATDWYEFLSRHRNFFTHEGAPYCAIEDRMVRPPEFDLIIMRANITDFEHANPSEFFRVSECQPIVHGIQALSRAAQHYLADLLGQ
jgi:hypothetical protein